MPREPEDDDKPSRSQDVTNSREQLSTAASENRLWPGHLAPQASDINDQPLATHLTPLAVRPARIFEASLPPRPPDEIRSALKSIRLETIPEFAKESPVPAVAEPDFAGIAAAKKAIANTQKRYRQSQRSSRLTRGAFMASGEVDNPDRIPRATIDTIDNYQRRGRSLFGRYKRERSYGLELDDIDPLDFVIWLEGMRPLWKDVSWRTNRQAATAFIKTIPHENLHEALALLESIGGDNSSRRNALIASRMEHSHFQKILQAIRLQSRSEVTRWAGHWMIAAIYTGVRPEEWRLTDISRRSDMRGERIWLHIFNVRVPETNLAGSYRTIDLSKFSMTARGAVEHMVKLAREWTLSGIYDTRKIQVSNLITETADLLYPRMKLRYTLDSLHYQFIENMKSIHRQETLSALIGEMLVELRASNYKNHRRAWDDNQITEIPLPLIPAVNRYRRSLAVYHEYRELRSLRERQKNQTK